MNKLVEEINCSKLDLILKINEPSLNRKNLV